MLPLGDLAFPWNGHSRPRAVRFAGGRRAAGPGFEPQLAAPPVATRNELAWPPANRRAPRLRFPFPAYRPPGNRKRETLGFCTHYESRLMDGASVPKRGTPGFGAGGY